MKVKKYRVQLEEEEREDLKALVSKGRAAAYKQTHARILLLSDENPAWGGVLKASAAARIQAGIGHGPRRRGREACAAVGAEGLERALGRIPHVGEPPARRNWTVNLLPQFRTGQACGRTARSRSFPQGPPEPVPGAVPISGPIQDPRWKVAMVAMRQATGMAQPR